MNLVRLTKMCLSKTYNEVLVGKYFSDMFPFRNGLKQGEFLSPLLLNFVLEVKVNQDDLKLNCTH